MGGGFRPRVGSTLQPSSGSRSDRVLPFSPPSGVGADPRTGWDLFLSAHIHWFLPKCTPSPQPRGTPWNGLFHPSVAQMVCSELHCLVINSVLNHNTHGMRPRKDCFELMSQESFSLRFTPTQRNRLLSSSLCLWSIPVGLSHIPQWTVPAIISWWSCWEWGWDVQPSAAEPWPMKRHSFPWHHWWNSIYQNKNWHPPH